MPSRCLYVMLTAVVHLVAFQKVGHGQSALLRNANGMEVQVIDVGAVIQRLVVPDFAGKLEDVVAGFDDPNVYLNNSYSPYFGATVGRVANRIKGGRFELDGKAYQIPVNDGPNALHGGTEGWSSKIWTITPVQSDLGDAVKLTYTSPDGDEGFPGTVDASVTYTVTEDNELIIDFEATTDAPTPIGMTQHSYFNLDVPGDDKTILNHVAFINGSYVTPVDSEYIPLGTFEAVAGTPYDFGTDKPIGSRIEQLNNVPVGYDINYVLFGLTGPEAKAATVNCTVFDEPQLAGSVYSPASGRALEIFTQTPGLQFYSGNSLDGSVVGKNGVAYPQYGAFAVESQDFPNFVNEPAFPSCILSPGEFYRYTTIWRFYTVEPTSSATTAPAPAASS